MAIVKKMTKFLKLRDKNYSVKPKEEYKRFDDRGRRYYTTVRTNNRTRKLHDALWETSKYNC